MKYTFRIVDDWGQDCKVLVARRYHEDGKVEHLTVDGWEEFPAGILLPTHKFMRISGQMMMEELKVLTILDEFEAHLRKYMALENSRD